MRTLLWDQFPFLFFLPPPVVELIIKDNCCNDVQDFWFSPFLATWAFERSSVSLCGSQR